MLPQDTISEEWRPVPVAEFAALYEVSNYGHIRRRNRTPQSRPWKPLVPYRQWHDYWLVTMHATPHKHRFSLHRLVAGAFLGSAPDGCEVNHIDGDKANNCAANLEYVTRQENLADADRRGLTRRGVLNGKAKLTDAAVRAIRASTEPQKTLAARYGVTQGVIWRVLRRHTWRHVA